MSQKQSCISLVLKLKKLNIPFLDVRLPLEYAKSRLENSCNIPLAEVSSTRAFELPPRHVPFAVVHNSTQRTSVLEFFSSRHTPWSVVAFLCTDVPSLSYHHSRLFAIDHLADLADTTPTVPFVAGESTSSLFIPGHGKRYRRQKDESVISTSADTIDASETTSSTAAAQHCVGLCASACDGLECASVQQLSLVPLATTGAASSASAASLSGSVDSTMRAGESADLWEICREGGAKVLGEDTAAYSTTLFHPCAPLVRFIDPIERALTHRALDNTAATPDVVILDVSEDADLSVAAAAAVSGVILRPKEEYLGPHAAFAAASRAEAGVNRNTHTLVFDCVDIGCGHARDSLWLVKRHTDVAQYTSQHSPNPAALPAALWRVCAVDEVAGILSTVVESARGHGVADRLLVTRTKLVEQAVKSRHKGGQKEKARALKPLEAQASSTVPASSPQSALGEAASVVTAETLARASPAPPAMTLLYNHKSLAGGYVCAWEQQQHDLVLCVRFLVPALLPQLDSLVRVGGFVVYQHFYEGCSHPANVLRPGQLRNALGDNWEVWCDEVEVLGDGRPVNNFVARKMSNKHP